ncbi:MAG TPA: flagellar basal body L-ring protein FlgH [Gammaproteobacteria bacterium]|nr:flagellar basal body L-ring protein FlgH [Gammaproteobacteria bacterium]
MNPRFSVALLVLSLLLGGCASMAPQEPLPQVDYSKLPVPPARASDGSLYHPGNGAALFEDLRARRVGDILTVLLVEETKASKSASTSISKDNATEVENPTLFGKSLSLDGISHGRLGSLEQRLKSSKEFTGTGKSDQSNKLKGTIQVTVVETLPNGYLRIAGEKVLTINKGDERVRLTGIVRPQDILTNNTVSSRYIANARITYSGTGVLADSNDMGWLSKFFNSKWFPF